LVVFGIRDFASVGNEELQSLDRVNGGDKLARVAYRWDHLGIGQHHLTGVQQRPEKTEIWK
jgi:hypothetical protein